MWGLCAISQMGTVVTWDPPYIKLILLRLEAFSLNLILNLNPNRDGGMEAARQQMRECLPTVPLLSWPRAWALVPPGFQMR